jgi:HK97 gp10 family phage protein
MAGFSIKFDTSALADGLDALGAAAEANSRPAAQAGAQVLYDEVVQRAPVAKAPVKRKGKTIQPGALRRSIYQVFSADNSGQKRATYHVSWNAKKAPHGHLVEFGTSRAPAHPFLRPAFDAKIGEALKAANDRWAQETGKVIAGLKA